MTVAYSEFYNFPFLRDQLFISFFKSFPLNISNFDDFILKTQAEYYRKFINPEFDTKLLEAPNSNTNLVSKCPFASKSMYSTSYPSFAIENISRLRYTLIDNCHISDMNLNGLTINVVKPGGEMVHNCPVYMFTSGIHKRINFGKGGIFILTEDSIFTELVELEPEQEEIFNEMVGLKEKMTASDIRFFFPTKIIIINPINLDKVLNSLIYLSITNSDSLNIEFLKSILRLGGTVGTPSQFEAYQDVLSIEFIRKNHSLFKIFQ